MDAILKIDSDTNILGIIHSFLENDLYLAEKRIEISEDLPNLEIRFTGPTYHSSISPNSMLVFLGLQDTIYSIYSIYTDKKIDDDIRHELEFNVTVSEGSSIFKINLDKISNALSERIKKITKKELAGIIAAICLTFLINSLGSKTIDRKNEIDKLKIYSETSIGIQKNTIDAMLKALESQQSIIRILYDHDFDTLEINGKSFTKAELFDIRHGKAIKQNKRIDPYQGRYRILDSFYFNVDGKEHMQLEIVRISSYEIIKDVILDLNQLDPETYAWFRFDSKGKELEMTLHIETNNGKKSAYIRKIFEISDNNRTIKTLKKDEKMEMRDGVYFDQGGITPYCPKCLDNNSIKAPLVFDYTEEKEQVRSVNQFGEKIKDTTYTKHFKCSVCKTLY